jgi:hypothetical protein
LRLTRKLSWLAVAALTTVAVFAPGATALAASVTPVFLAGASNTGKDCVDIDQDYGQTWSQAKQDPNGNGDIVVTDFGTITISNTQNDKTFDWTSTFGIDAVIAKGGSDGSYAYVYATSAGAAESFGDTGLTTPGQNAISHISFCYDAANPQPTPTPTSTTAPTPTPTSTTAPTATPTATTAPTATPQPTEVPNPTPEPTPAPTEEPNPTATPTGEVNPATGTPAVTLPPTDAALDGTAAPAGETWRLIILAMAGILAAGLLLTPASAVRPKDESER